MQQRTTIIALLAGLGLVMAGLGRHSNAAEQKVPLTIAEGHDIGQNDFGRPVVLIAAALGVTPEIFREAFSGVTPARGRGPSGEEARRNKAALLKVLGPHGITNERLDQVSDYYRYQPQRGELWPTRAARAYALVTDGQITKIVVTDGGAGYSSTPKISVKGCPEAKFAVTLSVGKDLKQNGSIAAIELAQGKK